MHHFVNEQESEEEKDDEEGNVQEETTASRRDQEDGSRQGWRSHSGVKRKGQTSVADGILAVSDSLADIAAAFKSTRTQENHEDSSLRPDERSQVMQSLQDLTQSVRAQTEMLTQLVRLVSGGASLSQDGSSAVRHQPDGEEETQISL
ncbi:hypothetical protein PF010_g25960 [Phytophthora fragariae]|uniref:Uncharacterized protein n=1 Tax=Phytophthora fragariae TaxID=53985 RepID=A0A6G0JZ22_9STRA|nr:hypothetical protein PF010_g25960 [Phytophthora fragariae]